MCVCVCGGVSTDFISIEGRRKIRWSRALLRLWLWGTHSQDLLSKHKDINKQSGEVFDIIRWCQSVLITFLGFRGREGGEGLRAI